MKRLHLHLKTDDLDKSVVFYSALFDAEPVRREADYAKWLLDDPRAHISVSTHGGTPGFDHAGVSIETEEELEAVSTRLREAGADPMAETDTTCCYARSNKYWVREPNGAMWELFQTFADSDDYGAEPDREAAPADSACCAPATR